MRRRLLGILVLMLAAALPAAAQNSTLVSGTITDPNGLPYSFAQVQAQLIPIGGTPTVPPPCNNQAAVGCVVPAFLPTQTDVNGSFSMTMASNAALNPSGTHWQFTVNENGVPPPIGFGPQSFVVTLTISGATQSITAALNAAAPALARITGGTTGVTLLNGLTGALTISPGIGIGVSAAGSSITISNQGAYFPAVGTNCNTVFLLSAVLNPQLATTTGYFNAQCYSGDAGAQLATAVAAAIAAGGGTADASSALLGPLSWTSGELATCGDLNSDAVNIDLPPSGTSTITATGGTSALVTAYTGCAMHSPTLNQFSFVNGSLASSTSTPTVGAEYGLLVTRGTQTLSQYFDLGPFGITQHSKGFSSGIECEFEASQDVSYFHGINCFDSSTTDTAIIRLRPVANSNLCCGVLFSRITADGNSVGPTGMVWQADSTSGYNQWFIYFDTASIGQPKAGVPNFSCVDTSSTFKITGHITMLYEEPTHGLPNDAEPFNIFNNCNHIWIDEIQAMSFSTGEQGPIVQVNGTIPEHLHFGHMYCDEYSDPWVLPCVGLQDNVRNWTVKSDPEGHVGTIDTDEQHFGGVESFRDGLTNSDFVQYRLSTPTVITDLVTLDPGSGADITQLDCESATITAGQACQFQLFRNTNITGAAILQVFPGDGTSTPGIQFSGKASTASYVAGLTGQCFAIGNNTACTGKTLLVGTANQFTIDPSGNTMWAAGSHLGSQSGTSDTFGTVNIASSTTATTSFTTSFPTTVQCTVTPQETTAGTIPATGAFSWYPVPGTAPFTGVRVDVANSGTWKFTYHCFGD